MRREVQLYIQDTRVDLFQDETISITDSIQNISDISVVFTPFSKQFNLPASQVNNKLFKHYYNFDIQNGFDARFTVDARIEINHTPFKSGKIRLNGVSMKDNLPHTYKVVFFGEPNSLKELFADEDLNALNGLSTYDINYSNSDFLQAFKVGLQSTGVDATNTANRNIVVPLILLKNYYTYNTGSTNQLHNVNFPVLQTDLKPAIKLKRIIEAIQTQYNITFNMSDSGSIKTFFGSDMFDELYLWLHREKSPISAPETDPPTFGVDTTTKNKKLTFADFTYSSGDGDVLTNDTLIVDQGDSYNIRISLTPSVTSTGEVIVKDIKTNELLYYKENISFISGISKTIPLVDLTSGNLSQRTYDIQIRLNAETNITFTSVSMLINKNATTAHNYTASNFTLGSNIFIQDYIPKMKVIDFLTGLFKMFNLVAYTKRGSSTIFVQTFDDFMTLGTTRDITQYIDISQSTIDRPVPYNQVNFRYSSPVTQTSLRFVNQFSQVFGDLNYSAPEKYDGQSFSQDVPFERTVLINQETSGGVTTGNILAWWVDDSGSTALGKPYIFFNRVIDQSGGSGYPITSLNLTAYNAPSNVSSDQNHTLNFGAEYDEFNGDVNSNSLFSRFYEQYIIQTFNQNGRIIKVSANLPISFVLNYSVNDIIVINAQEYYINSIQTDLTTGKSQLELIVKKATYTNSVLT
tara:strand:+ start:2785 stop:4854 length:2070 start_codon:yes stop_codon:yes gene_type:complete